MNAEQRAMALVWSGAFSLRADGDHSDGPLDAPAFRSTAALLRAGIAASEECERLERELAETQWSLRQLRLAEPLEIRTDNRETLKNALAEIELTKAQVTRLCSMLYDEQLRRMMQTEGPAVRDMLRRLSEEEISNGKAAEIVLDFTAGASATAWLAAWDAEWRAQRPAWRENAKLRALLERAVGLLGTGLYDREWVRKRKALLAEIEGTL